VARLPRRVGSGMRLAYGKPPFPYANLAYYHPVRAALADGVTEIDLGVESYEAKLSRGCDAHPLWWFVKVPGLSSTALDALAQARSAETEKLLSGLAARFGRRWHGRDA